MRTLVAACFAWPAVVHAERAGAASRIPEDAEPARQSLSEATRLELIYPEHRTLFVERAPISVPSLQLGRADKPATTQSTAPQGQLPAFEPSTEPVPSALLLWPESSIIVTAKAQSRRSAPQDERSAWARWHSGLWGASATIGAAMFATVGILSFLPTEVSGWQKPTFYGLKRNFTHGPNFDYDHDYFNYVFHPYDGSEFYLIARNRKLTWWQSFAYGVAVSTSFEFLIESAYEGASWQDLWITPVSGAVIGELRWQAKKALEDPGTGKPTSTVGKILYVVIDPVDAIFKL
jgi:hypothetical protein